ncbi:MAG TPA: hypothetical protein PLR06_12000 [Cyclobacteriaceae bacterium]|nr:hypothetical protein [Cyclobacteriaceae bacterium]
MQSQPDAFLNEPGFALRAGIKNFKIQMQYGISVNATRKKTLAGLGLV